MMGAPYMVVRSVLPSPGMGRPPSFSVREGSPYNRAYSGHSLKGHSNSQVAGTTANKFGRVYMVYQSHRLIESMMKMFGMTAVDCQDLRTPSVV